MVDLSGVVCTELILLQAGFGLDVTSGCPVQPRVGALGGLQAKGHCVWAGAGGQERRAWSDTRGRLKKERTGQGWVEVPCQLLASLQGSSLPCHPTSDASLC